MLPVLSKDLRVTRPADFAAVLRTGSRAGTRHLALSLRSASGDHGPKPSDARVSGGGDRSSASGPGTPSARPARAGFVVSGAVGNSVVRHRVTRRLREQIRPLLGTLPAGTDVVVRAFPAAAAASSEQLGRDLRSALQRVRSR